MAILTLKSRKGIEYFRSDYDGSWFRKFKWDKPNRFIGCERNLPKEILKQLPCTLDHSIDRSRGL